MVVTGLVGTLVVVTLVPAWAGEGDEADDATGGGVEALSDVVGLAVRTGLGLVEFDELDFTVVVLVVAVGGEDEVGFGETVGGLVAVTETFWGAAGVGVTVAGAGVTVAGVGFSDDRAEACGKSVTAVALVGADLAVVVTAGVTVSVFDVTLVAVVIVVAGTDGGTALTAVGDDDEADGGVATVVVLAESGPIVFTVVDNDGFGSAGALEAVENTSVCFTPWRVDVDVTVLESGSGTVVVGVAVTETVADVESVIGDVEEAWVDALSRL